mmetsp:Transcript_18839/g.21608  ORF Transcript_18839/g.21608 Transcript_18839/m.21608 type:complete len:235 (+) Transcript_18839:288-992(+)
MMSNSTTRQPMQVTMTFYVVILLSCLFSSTESLSFQPRPLPTTTASSSLEMRPGQGNQLAAAYNAATCDKEQEEEELGMFHRHEEDNQEQDQSSHWRALASSKSFLTRVFHKPAVKHPIADVDIDNQFQSPRFQFPFTNFLRNLNHKNNHNDEEEAVYYPIVGFTFVKGCDNALSMHTQGSIRMPTTSQKKQEVYGWYSTSCKLDLCTDDETMCHNPTTATTMEMEEVETIWHQ